MKNIKKKFAQMKTKRKKFLGGLSIPPPKMCIVKDCDNGVLQRTDQVCRACAERLSRGMLPIPFMEYGKRHSETLRRKSKTEDSFDRKLLMALLKVLNDAVQWSEE